VGGENAQIFGGTARAAGRQGRDALRIFRNERVVGAGKPDLCNFLEERIGLHEGLAGRNCTVLGGTAWETGTQNCAIPRGNWQLATGVTGSQNCTIPRGSWQPKLHNSQRELAIGCSVTDSRNYTIPRGN